MKGGLLWNEFALVEPPQAVARIIALRRPRRCGDGLNDPSCRLRCYSQCISRSHQTDLHVWIVEKRHEDLALISCATPEFFCEGIRCVEETAVFLVVVCGNRFVLLNSKSRKSLDQLVDGHALQNWSAHG
jgi:hypothetical protein